MKKKQILFYLLILSSFIALSLIIGKYHEPWADEAHAWLIARDTSFYTLFFKYLHTDGHPALWHLIIKLFQTFGLKYEKFYIISTIFSSLGVAVFLFKSKFKWYIKLLLPFSYFVLYQYTIVARGYCLILLLLSCVASLWEDRIKKCYLFTFFLILLMSSEAYTFLLTGMIYLIYIKDYIKQKDQIANKKSLLTCLIILAIFFILTVLYVFPIPSNTFSANGPIYYISDSFITCYNQIDKFKLLLSSGILFFLYKIYLKDLNKKKFYELIFLLIPIFLFLYIKYYNIWHLGIFLLAFFFVLWIQNFVNSKWLNIFLVACLFVQVTWSFNSIKYDYTNNYSSAKDVANFIKEYDYENLTIFGSSFYDSAINPYFDKNIFDNWNEDIGFFYWNTKNKYYKQPINAKIYDMIVISDLHYNELKEPMSWIKEQYNVYYFEGYSYAENFKYEPQGTIVYVLKNIDNEKN